MGAYCGSLTPTQLLERSTVVFSGKAIAGDTIPWGLEGANRYMVAVDSVWRGHVPALVTVMCDPFGECLPMQVGHRYVAYAQVWYRRRLADYVVYPQLWPFLPLLVRARLTGYDKESWDDYFRDETFADGCTVPWDEAAAHLAVLGRARPPGGIDPATAMAAAFWLAVALGVVTFVVRWARRRRHPV